jgi:hypothetical protein
VPLKTDHQQSSRNGALEAATEQEEMLNLLFPRHIMEFRLLPSTLRLKYLQTHVTYLSLVTVLCNDILIVFVPVILFR